MWTGERLALTRHLREELDNFRAAIHWSYQNPQGVEKGIQMAEAISRRFMQIMGLIVGARGWLEEGLELASDPPLPPMVKIKAMGTLTWLEFQYGNEKASQEWAEKCIELCRRNGNQARAELSWVLSIKALIIKDSDISLLYVCESVDLAREVGGEERWYLPCSLQSKAMYVYPIDESQAFELLNEKYRLHAEMGDRWSCAGALWYLGLLHYSRKEYDLAERELIQALALCIESEDKISMLINRFYLCVLYTVQGENRKVLKLSLESLEAFYPCVNPIIYVRLIATIGYLYINISESEGTSDTLKLRMAGKLLAYAKQLNQSIQAREYKDEDPNIHQAKEVLRCNFTQGEFTGLWEEGSQMQLSEAVTLALSLK